MQLTKMSVEAFSSEIASSSPAPGGGSAAAQSGSMGAALVSMVASLTVSKEKDEQRIKELEAMMAQANAAKDELCSLIDLDTDAFLKVSAAYAMPKGSDEEKKERSAAIQKALEGCTLTPLSVIEQCAKAACIAAELSLNFNENAASDLGSAAACLEAGLKSAWLNVLINVGSLKDKEKAEGYKAKAKELYEACLANTHKVFSAIEESLG